MIETDWILKKFEELTPHELYAIIKLRNEVFVVEQDCVFQDADDKDQTSFHLMGMNEGKLVAYSRIVPPGIAYKEPSIGRVVSSPSLRGTGIGKELMIKSIESLYKLFNNAPIKIGAQVYLLKFYSSFGFTTTGDIYLEDGIEHITMFKP